VCATRRMRNMRTHFFLPYAYVSAFELVSYSTTERIYLSV